MINKKKRFLLKIGALLSVVALAFTCVMVKSNAYTYDVGSNIIYSNNALPFLQPEKIISTNDYSFINAFDYDEMYYNFTYQDNYYYSALVISLYSGDTDSDYVSELYNSTALSGVVNNIQVSLFNGKTLSYCIANYSNYRVRFMLRSSGSGLPYQYSYLQFNFGEMFSYLSQFNDIDVVKTNYVITCGWTARPSTQDNRNFRFYSQMGFYVGGNSAITNYDYYGLNGEYRNQWNDSIFESYQTTIESLQQRNDTLTKQVNTLNEQLNDTLGWKPLFFAIADVPFKTVQNFLGFEVLGVDMFGAFIGFITVLAILWVLKKFIK